MAIVEVNSTFNSPFHGFGREVLFYILCRSVVGVCIAFTVVIVFMVKQCSCPCPHVIGGQHSPKLWRQDLGVDELMQAVEVVTMQEYLYVCMQVKTQGCHQKSSKPKWHHHYQENFVQLKYPGCVGLTEVQRKAHITSALSMVVLCSYISKEIKA